MKVEIYRDARDEWRWRLRHRNGRILADSGEGYKRRSACVRAWSRIFAYITVHAVPLEIVK